MDKILEKLVVFVLKWIGELFKNYFMRKDSRKESRPPRVELEPAEIEANAPRAKTRTRKKPAKQRASGVAKKRKIAKKSSAGRKAGKAEEAED